MNDVLGMILRCIRLRKPLPGGCVPIGAVQLPPTRDCADSWYLFSYFAKKYFSPAETIIGFVEMVFALFPSLQATPEDCERAEKEVLCVAKQ